MGISKRAASLRARLAGSYGIPAVAICLAIALISSLPSAAQVVSATLTGTVTDSSGASVPDAAVTATETNTGVTRTIKTNGEGIYTLPFLGPGTYRVTIEKQGFKKFEQSNFALDLSTVGRVNAMLIPGSLQETVEVTAEAPHYRPRTARWRRISSLHR